MASSCLTTRVCVPFFVKITIHTDTTNLFKFSNLEMYVISTASSNEMYAPNGYQVFTMLTFTNFFENR